MGNLAEGEDEKVDAGATGTNRRNESSSGEETGKSTYRTIRVQKGTRASMGKISDSRRIIPVDEKGKS